MHPCCIDVEDVIDNLEFYLYFLFLFCFFHCCLFPCDGRQQNLIQQSSNALNAIDALSAFKKMFRNDHDLFNSILENISPFIKVTDEVKAFNSSGGPVPLRTKLAVSLRWLAGGSYLDLCFGWGVTFSTFYHPNGVLWPTLEAIDKAYSIGFPIGNK
jgi:hypothetical protein